MTSPAAVIVRLSNFSQGLIKTAGSGSESCATPSVFVGKCTGPFHTMFDLQWSSSTGEGDNSASFYRTLITREDVVWQYINQDQKPVDDYPVHVKEEYIGLTANPDAVFQLYDYKTGFFGDVYVLFGK